MIDNQNQILFLTIQMVGVTQMSSNEIYDELSFKQALAKWNDIYSKCGLHEWIPKPLCDIM